jgi:exodeoxyribonuclease VII large subunit
VAAVQARLGHAVKYQLERVKQRLLSVQRSIALLGPEQTLQRGYSITRKTSGEIVQRSGEVEAGEEILTRLAVGELRSTVSAEPLRGNDK